MSDGFPVDTLVTYSDEPDPPTIRGVVHEPTSQELVDVVTMGYADEGVGPDHGDVIVEWNADGTRSWENPSDLRALQT